MAKVRTIFFEWDDAESQRNLRERGFGFDHAAQYS